MNQGGFILVGTAASLALGTFWPLAIVLLLAIIIPGETGPIPRRAHERICDFCGLRDGLAWNESPWIYNTLPMRLSDYYPGATHVQSQWAADEPCRTIIENINPDWRRPVTRAESWVPLVERIMTNHPVFTSMPPAVAAEMYRFILRFLPAWSRSRTREAFKPPPSLITP